MQENKRAKAFEVWSLPGICLIMTIMLAFFDIYVALIALFLTAFASYATYKKEEASKNKLKNYIDHLDIAFEGLTKNAVFKMPFPITVLDKNGAMLWYNNNFKELSKDENSIVGRKIYEVFPSLEAENFEKKDKSIVDIDDKKFQLMINTVDDSKIGKIRLVYLIDVTDHQNLIDLYENEKLIMANVQIDNYDELTQTTPNEKRPLLFAQIDRIVSLYFHDYGAFIKKYENDKYFGVIKQHQLNDFEANKFNLVDQVRDLKSGNDIPATLSIGIGINEESPRELERSANAALEIALGRGGDQIVIKNKEDLSYFGGKNKATEKRTKVKARVIAHALGQLIDKSTEVFVMGHKNPDMDSFGSALGLVYAAKMRDKKAYLVLKEVTPAIKNLYNRAIDNVEGLKDMIISPDKAYEKIKPSDLIIVTDNHRKNSTEEPRLLDESINVVIIDHHRRGKDYIQNASLIYLEPYASSSAELVTEMLMYMNDNVDIDRTVSEGLLAGITVDTKNFSFQTGVRTFEAASVLKRNGADSTVVKELFKDDFDTIKIKAEIISKAEKYFDDCLISLYEKDTLSPALIASQAADELLSADGIASSFVLIKDEDKIHISARSLGEVSVQLIMEALGGGGHLTASAVQLDCDIKEAKERLLEAIETYKKGEDE
ncbi:MAG: DHH family phosphoesterase [Tissierellia bacterium]|nr:DHH family phosphoesterase [Tissierellia bacterium]